jgi:hypothetical protein
VIKRSFFCISSGLLGSIFEVLSFYIGETLLRLLPPKKPSLSSILVLIYPEWRANYDLREESTFYCCRISAGLPKEIEIRTTPPPAIFIVYISKAPLLRRIVTGAQDYAYVYDCSEIQRGTMVDSTDTLIVGSASYL